MKNIPHQFSSLTKYFDSLIAIKELIEEETPLKDENLGEKLIRKGIIEPRDKSISIDAYIQAQEQKTTSNRSYYTTAREIRRFFELLGFLTVASDKSAYLSPQAIQLIAAPNENVKKHLWRDAILRMGVEGTDGEISHPYRILLKLIQDKTGIETKKLMLALEAENDSLEEYDRIIALSEKTLEEIIQDTGTSNSMVRNAVKILPAIAEQLGDIVRRNNRAYPIGKIVITEDEISTEVPEEAVNQEGVPYSQYRQVTSDSIARDPIFNEVSAISIDLTESIRIRQDRLALHQQIVRKLGLLCEERGFDLYEGKFDCLASKPENTLLFEVKTIKDSMSDQEKQTVKGVGQLKYYNFSIVHKQMGIADRQEFIVYSQQPNNSLIEFCHHENIDVVWIEEDVFKILEKETGEILDFEPTNYI